MDKHQINSCVHTLLGYWPSPVFTEDESLALVGSLARFSRQEFDMALQSLLNQPSQFRPPPAEVARALRSARFRVVGLRPSLPSGSPAPETVSRSYLSQARETLIKALPWTSRGHAALLRARYGPAQVALEPAPEEHA